MVQIDACGQKSQLGGVNGNLAGPRPNETDPISSFSSFFVLLDFPPVEICVCCRQMSIFPSYHRDTGRVRGRQRKV